MKSIHTTPLSEFSTMRTIEHLKFFGFSCGFHFLLVFLSFWSFHFLYCFRRMFATFPHFMILPKLFSMFFTNRTDSRFSFIRWCNSAKFTIKTIFNFKIGKFGGFNYIIFFREFKRKLSTKILSIKSPNIKGYNMVPSMLITMISPSLSGTPIFKRIS